MTLTRLHSVGNYDTALFDFIKLNEKFKPKLYLDSKGIATIKHHPFNEKQYTPKN